jgi:hypothetical protein
MLFMQSLFNTKRILFLAGAILFCCIILILLSLFSEPAPSPTSVQPTPLQPTTFVKNRLTADEKPLTVSINPNYVEKLQKEPFWAKLPYWTDRYKIEYKDSADKLVITLFIPPTANGTESQFTQEAKTAALDWLRDNGAHVESLTIEFQTTYR